MRTRSLAALVALAFSLTACFGNPVTAVGQGKGQCKKHPERCPTTTTSVSTSTSPSPSTTLPTSTTSSTVLATTTTATPATTTTSTTSTIPPSDQAGPPPLDQVGPRSITTATGPTNLSPGDYANVRFGYVTPTAAGVYRFTDVELAGFDATHPGVTVILDHARVNSGLWFEGGSHDGWQITNSIIDGGGTQALRPKGPGTITVTDSWLLVHDTPLDPNIHTEVVQGLEGADGEFTRVAFSIQPRWADWGTPVTAIINVDGPMTFTDSVFGYWDGSGWSAGGGFYAIYGSNSTFIRPTIHHGGSGYWYPPEPTVIDPRYDPITSVALGFTKLNAASDEFDGPAGFDTAKWHAKTHGANRAANVTRTGTGLLDVSAVRTDAGWTTGWLSGNLAYQGPRYVEVRALTPAGQGAWSAPLWEWDHPYGARQIEVDVNEQFGQEPDSYHVNLHTEGNAQQLVKVVHAPAPVVESWHTYGAAIYEDHVDWYVDGARLDSHTAAEMGSEWPWTTTPMVPNIDLFMGGWAGAIDPALTEEHMLVDYVHVWMRP